MTNPVGRPSDYDPSYCEVAIELGKQGKSTEAIGARIGVGTATLYRWRDKHEEFREALELAKEYELEWWEEVAMKHMLEEKDQPKLNASIWTRSMSARFPKKYRESIKQEITGAEGGPLQIQEVKRTIVDSTDD
jgi:transposase-like protein